jgi:hypothetical protein
MVIMYVTASLVWNRPRLLNLKPDTELFSKKHKHTFWIIKYKVLNPDMLSTEMAGLLVGYMVRTEANNVIFGMELFVPAWLVTAWP